MTIDKTGFDDPKFLTLIADNFGEANWVFTVNNYDTGYKPVDILVNINKHGEMHFSTRPNANSSWSDGLRAERDFR